MRLGGQCANERDPLRLAPGQLARHRAGSVAEPGAVEPLTRDPRRVMPQPEGHVVEDRHVREQDVVLEDDPDAAAFGRDVPAGG